MTDFNNFDEPISFFDEPDFMLQAKENKHGLDIYFRRHWNRELMEKVLWTLNGLASIFIIVQVVRTVLA